MTIDPMTCEHAQRGRLAGKTFCAAHECWTECGEDHWGEPPMCAYDEPDNGPEACARRRDWKEEDE